MNLRDIYHRLYTECIIDVQDPDKSNCDKGSTHSYIDFYSILLSYYRDNPINLLEIGVQGGVCLLLWEKYFINANSITGIDIDISQIQNKVILHAEKTGNIKICNGDATSSDFISSLNKTYDIIIDDGSHAVKDQLQSFILLEGRLNVGGIYIIEDIQNDAEADFLKKSIIGSYIIDLRSVKGRYDDVLIVYKKENSL